MSQPIPHSLPLSWPSGITVHLGEDQSNTRVCGAEEVLLLGLCYWSFTMTRGGLCGESGLFQWITQKAGTEQAGQLFVPTQTNFFFFCFYTATEKELIEILIISKS